MPKFSTLEEAREYGFSYNPTTEEEHDPITHKPKPFKVDTSVYGADKKIRAALRAGQISFSEYDELMTDYDNKMRALR